MALNFLNNGYFAGKVGIGVEVPTYTLELQVSQPDENPVVYSQFGGNNGVTGNSFLQIGGARGSAASERYSYLQTLDGAGGFRILSLNPSGGNVGIGETNPSEKLHMKNTTGTACFIRFQNTGGSGVYIGGRSESMEMYANGTLKMAIGSNGSVKFNSYNDANQTGTPTYLLGTDGSGNIVKTLPQGSGTAGPYLPLAGGTMSGNIVLDDDVQLRVGTDADLRIYHNGINNFILNTVGNLNIRQTADNGNITFQSDDGSGSYATYIQINGLNEQTQVYKDFRFQDSVVAKFGNGDDLRIHHNSANSFIENYTGDLSIVNYANDKDLVLWNDDGTGGIAKYLVLDGNTTHAYFSNPGNVGIGVTNPVAKLDISVTPSAPWIKLINANETAFNLTTYNNGTNNGSSAYAFKHGLYYNSTENAAVTFYRGGSSVGGFLTFTTNNGTERMRINSAGNVGIGTTNPLDPLNVQSTGASDYAFRIFRSTSTTQGLAGFYEGSANQGQLYLLKGDNTAGIFLNSNGDSYLNGGNVGIGTTLPSRPLHVNSGALNFVAEFQSTDDKASILIQDDDTLNYIHSQDGYLSLGGQGALSSGNLNIRTSDGNVGIGTTSPGTKLDVNGTGNFTGLVSGITPVAAANFVTKAYVDGSGGGTGPFLPLAGGTLTGPLTGTSATFEGNVEIRSGNKLILQRPNNGVATEISTDSTGAMILNSINDEGFFFNNNGTNAFKLDPINATFAGTATATSFVSSTDSGININGITMTRVAANSAIRVADGLETLGLLRSYAGLNVATTGTFGGNVTTGANITAIGNTGNSTLTLQANTGNWTFTNVQASRNLEISDSDGTGTVMTIDTSGNVGIGNTGPNYKLTVSGGIEAGGVITYSKVAGSLNTTGYAIAGLGTVFNGASAFFTFTASGGTGQYQRVVYSCAGVGTNWVVYKVIDEGTNVLDIEASATSAATIVFTFKTRSGTQAYSPRVVIQATGHSIISTYA